MNTEYLNNQSPNQAEELDSELISYLRGLDVNGLELTMAAQEAKITAAQYVLEVARRVLDEKFSEPSDVVPVNVIK